jgi:hypothetical protein
MPRTQHFDAFVMEGAALCGIDAAQRILKGA